MGVARILMVSCCAAAMVAATAAHAKSTTTGIETIVVTAQKRKENVQNVPISIQAFSARTLSNLGIKSSTGLGEVTPNLDIALPSGAGSQPIISIRGIGLNDYDSNNAGPNGVYLDEVYLSAPASQTFQIFDLKRVEVLKGPQGTLYGMNTSGGAINFITNKPTDVTTGNLHFGYGNFNTFNIEGAVGGPIADGLDGRIAIDYNKSDGYMNNLLTGSKENGQNNIAGRAMLQYQPHENLKFLLTVRGAQLDNRPNEYHHVGTLDPTTFTQCSNTDILAGNCVDLFGYGTPKNLYTGAYNRRQHLKIHDWGSSLRIDYTPGSWSFTSLTAYTHNDRFHPEDTDASPNRLLEINYGVRSNTFSQEFRASQNKKNYKWVAGLYYLNEGLHQNQPLFIMLDADKFFGGPGTGDGIAEIVKDRSKQTTDTYAVYGQGTYNLTAKLQLTLGGRYTGETKKFTYDQSYQYQSGGMGHFGPITALPTFRSSLDDTAFNWRAALDYHFTQRVMAYASVATGFKSGGFNGSFLSSDPAEIAKQLQPIKPEHVTAYEIGLKSIWLHDHLLFNADAFYNDYNNMQVFTLINSPTPGNPPVNVLDNAPKAHTDGVEVELIGKPVSNFSATFNFGYLETRLDSYSVTLAPGVPNYSGNVLPLAPKFSFSTILDYTIPVGMDAIDLQFNANYKSKQFFDTSNDPLTTQSAYWLENLRVGYSFAKGNWEVAAYVHNLSDQAYLSDAFDLSVPFGLIEQVVGMPRTYGVEFDYRF